MFAQMFVDRNFDTIQKSFVETTEQPVFKGFLLSIIAGTLAGGYTTYFILMSQMAAFTLAGAIAAGAAVGASAGLLLFGLGDVIIGGRLEVNAKLVEDEDNEETFAMDVKPAEKSGEEGYAYRLPKAS